MLKKYTLREEPFGYTFFDKRKLRHKFLLPNEVDTWYKQIGVLKDEVEIIVASEKSFRHDIVYSPIRIYFELTLACNLRCRYCFNESGVPRKDELDTEDTLNLLSDLRKYNVFRHSLHWW